MAEDEFPSLSTVFNKNLKKYEDIEKSTLPTNADELQEQIRESIAGLIKATVLVSELGVFSLNETVDELPTSSLKFLLLPVLLGSLSLKRTDLPREEVLRQGNVYLRDFIKRCRDYQLTTVEVPVPEEEEEQQEEGQNRRHTNKKPSRATNIKPGMPTPQELQAMGRQREEKLKRYKEKKTIENRLLELKNSIENPSTDEEIVRNYYSHMIKKFIYESLDELDSVMMETKMLAQVSALKAKGELPSLQPNPHPSPFKPILISRERVQRDVFGLGYPSRPSMTVEEFYDQRVKEGWFPDPSKRSNCLQDIAAEDAQSKQEAEEKEEEEREKAEEEDDPETLERARARDDWRDTHRRGWGNTHNRS